MSHKKVRMLVAALGWVKYIFSVLLTISSIYMTKDIRYCILGLVEILLICVFSDWLLEKKQWLGVTVNIFLCLIYNVQMMLLFFSTSYLQLVMLTNLDSIEALSAKGKIYWTGAILAVLFSVLPVSKIRETGAKAIRGKVACGLIALEMLLIIVIGHSYSPILAYYDLAVQKKISASLNQEIEDSPEVSKDYFCNEVGDFRKSNSSLPDRPNIILIFTEGLSQNIVTDSREIMPNLKEMEDTGLFFSNYYNHTFATYCGIIGQLYSGFQYNNLDDNSLVSFQSILRNEGYQTAFINTEPMNELFTSYLNNLGFDKIIGDKTCELRGPSLSICDKDAYGLLYDTAIEYQGTQPFCLVMYSFGTHASADSVDEVYGNGENRILNKFYNLDCQLGSFIEKYKISSLAEDTIVILTSDHATYTDNEYKQAFEYQGDRFSSLDKIPLVFYSPLIKHEVVDVNGKNSLALVPTILDYLDISAPNYFLGDSLFKGETGEKDFEYVYYSEGNTYETRGGTAKKIAKEREEFLWKRLKGYFAISRNPNTGNTNTESGLGMIAANISADVRFMEIEFETPIDYEEIQFPIWSDTDDAQGDIQWYQAERKAVEDGQYLWSYTVDLTKHILSNVISVHVYGKMEDQLAFAGHRRIIVPDRSIVIEAEDNMQKEITLMTSEDYKKVWATFESMEEQKTETVRVEMKNMGGGYWTGIIDLNDYKTLSKLSIPIYAESLQGTTQQVSCCEIELHDILEGENGYVQ